MGKTLDDAKRIYGEYYDQLLQLEELLKSSNPEDGKTLNSIIDKTEAMVKQLGRPLTTSQLRNIYAKIKVSKDPKEAVMLRPKLAYIAARQRNADARIIPNLISELLSRLSQGNEKENENQLKSLKTYVEMIVAYHKSHFS